jgi:hypothetical protein
MNNDSVVSPGGLGGSHLGKRGLKKRAQAVNDFILAAGTRETHAVPKYERGKMGWIVRCKYDVVSRKNRPRVSVL